MVRRYALVACLAALMAPLGSAFADSWALGVITPTGTVGWATMEGVGAVIDLPLLPLQDETIFVTVNAEDAASVITQVVGRMAPGFTTWDLEAWVFKPSCPMGCFIAFKTGVAAGHTVELRGYILPITGGGYQWWYYGKDITTGQSWNGVMNGGSTSVKSLKNLAQQVYMFESWQHNSLYFDGKTAHSYPTVRYYNWDTSSWTNSVGNNYVMTSACGARFGIDFRVGSGAPTPYWWLERGKKQNPSQVAGDLLEGYLILNGVNSCTPSSSPQLWP